MEVHQGEILLLEDLLQKETAFEWMEPAQMTVKKQMLRPSVNSSAEESVKKQYGS